MSMSVRHEARPRRIDVQRCRDPELIARILRRDYFDDPFPHLSNGAIRTFARDCAAPQNRMYLLTAEVDGSYAGFVFGHTLGPQFWRLFARAHPRHLPALLWARARMKVSEKFPRRSAPVPPDAPGEIEARIAALGISSVPRPFAWAEGDGRTGIIPLVFVSAHYRGHGLAQRLLETAVKEMFAGGASCVEAHIDIQNLSSVRAFMKSGWEVCRMSTNDFRARKKVSQ